MTNYPLLVDHVELYPWELFVSRQRLCLAGLAWLVLVAAQLMLVHIPPGELR